MRKRVYTAASMKRVKSVAGIMTPIKTGLEAVPILVHTTVELVYHNRSTNLYIFYAMYNRKNETSRN